MIYGFIAIAVLLVWAREDWHHHQYQMKQMREKT